MWNWSYELYQDLSGFLNTIQAYTHAINTSAPHWLENWIYIATAFTFVGITISIIKYFR